MTSVHQGTILGPVLFNIFNNYLDNGIECLLSKFSDDVKLNSTADAIERRDAIQRDPPTWTVLNSGPMWN